MTPPGFHVSLIHVQRLRSDEVDGDRVSDLHLWRIGPGHAALVAAIVSDHPQEPAAYTARLTGIKLLSHVTVEVNPCKDRAAAAE